MQTVKIALDLDRVIFDTNTYFKTLNADLQLMGTSFDKVFSGTEGRKSIDFLFDELSKDFGEKRVATLRHVSAPG